MWNFLINSLRILTKYRLFFLINVMGFSVGLAASLINALWVFDELSYDKFNKNYKNIYRVEHYTKTRGEEWLIPKSSAIYGETLKKNIPEIVDVARICNMDMTVWNYLEMKQKEKVMFCDPEVFSVFTFPLIKGNPETAFSEPFSVVLSEKAAKNYFGEDYPIDQTLEIEMNGRRTKFRVTGIMKDMPAQSHLHIEIAASFVTLEEIIPQRLGNWEENYLYTYILLHPKSTPEDIAPKLKKIVEQNVYSNYKIFMDDPNKMEEIHDIYQIRLRPLADIHLRAQLSSEIEPQGNINSVYFYSAISVLILIMACFNFMNLSTALGIQRAKEVGIKKTFGAGRGRLVAQFLSESILIALISFIVAWLAIAFVLPVYNAYSGKELNLATFISPWHLFYLLFGVMLCGLIAGIYPAFYLSRFRPTIIFQKKNDNARLRFSLRQVLVVLQFSISILLIISTITIYLQLNYIYNKPVGYDQDNLLVISARSKEVQNELRPFTSVLAQNPEIVNITSAGLFLTSDNFSDRNFRAEDLGITFNSFSTTVGYDFFRTYKIEFLAGRTFSKDYGTDVNNKFIVNERLVKKLGIYNPDDAIGMKYGNWGSDGKFKSGEIIGVVKDFHFKPMDEEIGPFTFMLNDNSSEYLIIRYNTQNVDQLSAWIETKWMEYFPHDSFNSFFHKTVRENLYKDEINMKNMLFSYTFLAIFLGCLGLFGLTAFVIKQKQREMAIRKIHGASNTHVLKQLTKPFMLWVLLANIISWPFALYFLDNWLSKFYYRIEMPYWVFILSGLLALTMALITISYKVSRAANSNPLDVIKYE